MLRAHTEANGEPPRDHKRYLWGLAKQVVADEDLRLLYGVRQDHLRQVIPSHPGKSRGWAQSVIERTGEGQIHIKWESHWRPE